MNIVLIGDHCDLPNRATISVLPENLELAGQRLAVAVNEDVIPHGELTCSRLEKGHDLDIVLAVSGG